MDSLFPSSHCTSATGWLTALCQSVRIPVNRAYTQKRESILSKGHDITHGRIDAPTNIKTSFNLKPHCEVE